MSDDPIAPRRAVSALLDRFETASVVRRDVEPRDLGVAAIGHLGLLRPMAKTLWRDMLDFSMREVSARSAA